MSEEYRQRFRTKWYGVLSSPTLVGLLFELFSWLEKRFHPSDPDTMTNTPLEATASSSGKNHLCWLVIAGKLADLFRILGLIVVYLLHGSDILISITNIDVDYLQRDLLNHSYASSSTVGIFCWSLQSGNPVCLALFRHCTKVAGWRSHSIYSIIRHQNDTTRLTSTTKCYCLKLPALMLFITSELLTKSRL